MALPMSTSRGCTRFRLSSIGLRISVTEKDEELCFGLKDIASLHHAVDGDDLEDCVQGYSACHSRAYWQQGRRAVRFQRCLRCVIGQESSTAHASMVAPSAVNGGSREGAGL